MMRVELNCVGDKIMRFVFTSSSCLIKDSPCSLPASRIPRLTLASLPTLPAEYSCIGRAFELYDIDCDVRSVVQARHRLGDTILWSSPISPHISIALGWGLLYAKDVVGEAS